MFWWDRQDDDQPAEERHRGGRQVSYLIYENIQFYNIVYR